MNSQHELECFNLCPQNGQYFKLNTNILLRRRPKAKKYKGRSMVRRGTIRWPYTYHDVLSTDCFFLFVDSMYTKIINDAF